MANYPRVPQKEIVSVDIPRFDGGQYLNGEQDGPKTALVRSKDVELTRNGFIVPRRRLGRFLPDTVETSYEKAGMLWDNQLYFFTLDNGKVKYAREGDATWSVCGGDNTVTTNNGGMPKLLRVLNNVLVLNGTNGDKLCHVDLTQEGFPVVKHELIPTPTSALTVARTNLSDSTTFHVYYAYSYTGSVGETELSPILEVGVNFVRDQWLTKDGGHGSLTLTFNDTPPAGAKFRNLYIALAATAGEIQDTDMLQLATQIDLNNTTFVDDGSLSINLGAPAPTDNSTDGMRCDHGIVEDGNPILWGDVDNPYAIHIGGGGPNAMSFSTAQNGYKAEPQQGTNYYPASVIGFRNGQGQPALTVLYSNTEGLSKQAVIEQQTISYGEQSFTVWGVTEQHYGAAGVAAPNSAVNYNGKLRFFSTDGVMSAETQAAAMNVLSIIVISGAIDPYIREIRNEAMKWVVGAGWNNKVMWLVPANGFARPQQILVLDTNNKGTDGNGAWYTLNIPADWIGVVSPRNAPAFVYISQGKSSYKLLDSTSTFDTKSGVNAPFSTNATGTLIGLQEGGAHNTWQADVQAMFYIVGLIGKVTIGVTYRNQNGVLKTKKKVIEGAVFTPSAAGGWGDPQWAYAHFPGILGWGVVPEIDDSKSNVQSRDVRKPVRIDDIFNEAQWFISTDIGYNYFKLRAVSYEGINLGVRPDLQ